MTSSSPTPHGKAAKDIARVLAWYQDMGVDCAVSGEPVDWLRHGAPPGAQFAVPSSPVQEALKPAGSTIPARPVIENQPASTPTRTSAPTAPLPARARVEATSLAELGAKLAAFDGCGLKNTATKLCFYRGAEKARVMVIGEAPGREEDLAGKPFVGPAGQMLDKMLGAIGLTEADVHITNIVYWRPPGNRPPTPQETLACRPFLERQIEIVAPEAIVLLGGPAMKHMLGIDDGIMRVRGKWHDMTIGSHRVSVLPTLHPAFLLRTPAAKRLAWRDLLSLSGKLK